MITDEFGCISTASTAVTIIPKPTAVVNADQSVCEGVSVALSASGGDSYLWSPAEGLSDITVANPTAAPGTNYRVHCICNQQHYLYRYRKC